MPFWPASKTDPLTKEGDEGLQALVGVALTTGDWVELRVTVGLAVSVGVRVTVADIVGVGDTVQVGRQSLKIAVPNPVSLW